MKTFKTYLFHIIRKLIYFRLVCCLSVCLLQVWMLLQFINMQNRRKREAEKIRQMEKKAAQQLKENKKSLLTIYFEFLVNGLFN